jgi:hypothetical protein
MFAGLMSCSDLSRPDQLERLEVLSGSIDSMEVLISEIEPEDLDAMIQSSQEVSGKFEQLGLDTIDYKFAIRLDRFKRMGTSCAKVKFSFEQHKLELEEERAAVDNLVTDINAGNGRRDKYDEYIAFEEGKVAVLRTRLNEIMVEFNGAIDTYDELSTVLLSEINERFTQNEVQ